MNNQQLEFVENFTVEEPNYGRVEFQGKTDITDLDLADLIIIKN